MANWEWLELLKAAPGETPPPNSFLNSGSSIPTQGPMGAVLIQTITDTI